MLFFVFYCSSRVIFKGDFQAYLVALSGDHCNFGPF